MFNTKAIKKNTSNDLKLMKSNNVYNFRDLTKKLKLSEEDQNLLSEYCDFITITAFNNGVDDGVKFIKDEFKRFIS